MNNYKLALTRTYLITIQAKNKKDAKLFSEYYLGDIPDLSDENVKIEKNFSFNDIELVFNEAHEI